MSLLPEPASAQRPFFVHDPFYRGETARRTFFDGFALSGEVAYRPAERSNREEETGAPGVDPLGLSLRLDYQLARQLDLGAILNASGGQAGRSLSVSWVVLKYYEFVEEADYAFRLAIDPASDGIVGFPQMDAALIATLPISPNVMNNIAVGARRVRMGYDRWVRTQSEQTGPEAPAQPVTDAAFDVVRTRVMGWELHAMISYDLQFDLSGSNVFLTAAAEGGEYDLFETPRPERSQPASGGDAAPEPEFTSTYQTGVLWIRTGIEYNRPSFQLNPYIGFPLVQWNSENDEGLRSQLSAGFSLMLR